MMGIFLAYVGFIFFSVMYIQQGLSTQAKFTEFPRNVTATEGQNVEMSCAFQSGSASVYLEIQWWFLRAAEDQEAGAEVTGTQVELLPERDLDNDGTKISYSVIRVIMPDTEEGVIRMKTCKGFPLGWSWFHRDSPGFLQLVNGHDSFSSEELLLPSAPLPSKENFREDTIYQTTYLIYKDGNYNFFVTVKVQGNDISHKLQISKVRKKDEGLYECRVTDANYGDLQEYKAQAFLKVNANSHSRRMQAFEASPMWLQDMKPRKNISAAVPSSNHNSANQRARSTSSPEAAAKIPKQSPQSAKSKSPVKSTERTAKLTLTSNHHSAPNVL